MIEKIKKEFFEKTQEIIKNIRQQNNGETKQSYGIALQSLELSMGITGAGLNVAVQALKGTSKILGGLSDGFTSTQKMLGGMNKMYGVIDGVKGNK